MPSLNRFDELGSDTYPAALGPNTAFQDEVGFEAFPDFRDRYVGTPQRKGGGPSNHVQPVESGQGVEDFLRDPVRKVRVGRIVAHVDERHDRDRRQATPFGPTGDPGFP